MDDLLNWLRQELKNHPIGWLVLLLSVLFGIFGIVALFSDLGFSQEVTQYRYYILLLSLSLASLIVLVWLLVVTILENIKFQEKINKLEKNEQSLIHSQQAILSLLQEITKHREFEIIKVQFYENSVYIILSKKKTQSLIIGDEIKVFDTEDGKVLGIFEISENKTTTFTAKVNGFIDAVWSGYIHNQGNAETSAPPNTIAILFPKEVKNNE
ncbi:MAG TPA: hypothetical protein PKY82_06325 [Pyrinomonadaceae bacterium]|nr:hypothetical protein [Pyrinomonadaceae bacterium]